MRNYISTRAIFYNISVFDDTHVLQYIATASVIGRNDVDLQTQIQIQNESTLNSLPANWTIEPAFPNDAMTIYFLLDKDSLMFIFQAFAAFFVQDAVTNVPPATPILVNPKESPRITGWTYAGVKRAPVPSEKDRKQNFKGVPGLVEAFLGLTAYANALQSVGRIRDAGIVRFAVKNVNNHTWSITEAFDFLRKQRLL